MKENTEPSPSQVTPAAGIYYDVPFDAYQSWEAINHSILKEFARSPLHALHALENRRESTKSLRMGNALHVSTFEPERFAKEFIVLPNFDTRTKEGKASMIAAVEDIIGKTIDGADKFKKDELLELITSQSTVTPVTADEFAEVKAMGESIRRFKSAQKFIDGPGRCEVSCIWRDAESKVLCKGRFDKLTKYGEHDIIVELKSCQDAGAWAFAKAVASYRYASQAAYYIRGRRAATGLPSLHVIIAVENSAPYGVAVYTLADLTLKYGDTDAMKWLGEYAECKRSGNWPGYPDRVQVLSMPEWGRKLED